MRATFLDFKDPREIIQARMYLPTTDKKGSSVGFRPKRKKYKNVRYTSRRFKPVKAYSSTGPG